jgi:hypothetical protein
VCLYAEVVILPNDVVIKDEAPTYETNPWTWRGKYRNNAHGIRGPNSEGINVLERNPPPPAHLLNLFVKEATELVNG